MIKLADLIFKKMIANLEEVVLKSAFIAFKIPEIARREKFIEKIARLDEKKQKQILDLILRADADLTKIAAEAEKIKTNGIAKMKKIARDFRVQSEQNEKKKDLAQLENILREI